LQVRNQAFHLLLSGFLVGLDVVDHLINTYLSFLVLIPLCFLHILLDRFSSNDSQMILNDINIFIDFGDFLKLIQQGDFKDTFTRHVGVVNSLCREQGLQNVVISVEVTDFSVDKRNQNLENVVF
jgi:hypothetical protein